eukprot:TRINITY_DN26571_c0_g2_i1.p1 TRINITY_DN26571_c0_g2~~TRINITY_DN26571_c0_g2_i1.p1  ORF type:complete len:421 (-),score=65.20 TRINITY_DN26571_c0_g2_i1:318-1580(-)
MCRQGHCWRRLLPRRLHVLPPPLRASGEPKPLPWSVLAAQTRNSEVLSPDSVAMSSLNASGSPQVSVATLSPFTYTPSMSLLGSGQAAAKLVPLRRRSAPNSATATTMHVPSPSAASATNVALAAVCSGTRRTAATFSAGDSGDLPATESQKLPQLLWAPGAASDESSTDSLAGKIAAICGKKNGFCVVGSRGELPTARTMRALAKASETGSSPIEFRARWHEEPDDRRSLRFHAELGQTWSEFKAKWLTLNDGKPIQALSVTQQTTVHKLATALATEQRKQGGALLRVSHKSNTVLNIAAKALATLPHMAQTEALGCALVTVVRWPSMKRATKNKDVMQDVHTSAAQEAGKYLYVHLLLMTTPGSAEGDELDGRTSDGSLDPRSSDGISNLPDKSSSSSKEDSFDDWSRQNIGGGGGGG